MSEPLRTEVLLTPEEYLEAERSATVKHEYVGGRVYAMAGATAVHNRIVSNLHILLGQHLTGHPCEVFGSDMKLRAAEDVFYYPDLMVCCEPVADDSDYTGHARYVVEVTSPSTRRDDETEKAQAYWQVASVLAYLIVDQDALRIRVLRRHDLGWETQLLTGAEEALELESIGFVVPLSAVYARTHLT